MNDATAATFSASVLAGSFPGDLGIEVTKIERARVEGRLVADGRHLRPGGGVHGGVWTTFGDTLAAFGTMSNLAPGENFTTVEMKTNIFASADAGDTLTAVGEPLHRGRRTQVWEIKISCGERLAANFVCTQMVLGAAS
jgi:1,4-dihydroxy-2-naphthoyl-CoA hydrolase